MPQSKAKEIKDTVINIFDMSKNIYKLCAEVSDDAHAFSKVADIYTEREKLITKLQEFKANKDTQSEFGEFFEKYAKEIQKIVDLEGRIIEVLGKRKIEMAQKLRKINSNMNVLIYK